MFCGGATEVLFSLKAAESFGQQRRRWGDRPTKLMLLFFSHLRPFGTMEPWLYIREKHVFKPVAVIISCILEEWQSLLKEKWVDINAYDLPGQKMIIWPHGPARQGFNHIIPLSGNYSEWRIYVCHYGKESNKIGQMLQLRRQMVNGVHLYGT